MMSMRLAAATALVLLAGCGGDKPAAAPSPTPAPTSASPTPSPSPEPDQDHDGIPDSIDSYPKDPHNIAPRTVTVTCDSATFDIAVPPDGPPDFSAVWPAKAESCDADNVTPTTLLEQAAYKTSGYDDNDIGTLYAICAAADPGDVYAEAGFTPSPGQVAEIGGALTLCPKHPLAAKWRQAVQRGKADADLSRQGRLFGSGTYLVGKEIKPGRYVTVDVEGCYWERQNKAGRIIDNDFVISARRVEVTIRSTDYAFHSQSCGEWRAR